MTLRAHYEALAAVLTAALPAPYKVYQWDVPELPTYPYVLLRGGIGQESTEALCGTPDLLSLRPKITYAGATGASVLVAVDKVRDALRDRALTVPGWSATRMRQASLIDVQTDYDVTIPGTKNHPVFGVDEFPFTTQRT